MYYSLISSMNKVAPSLYTARTTAFASATAITDTTILNALNTFDLGLISNGLDTKMKALYPFVGGTATTHKYNFMNALDTDAAFRLQFNGGWIHSSTGAKPNGTNSYANTFLNPLTALNVLNNHLSYYSRTDISEVAVEIGNYAGLLPFHLRVGVNYTSSNDASFVCSFTAGNPTTGLYLGTKLSNIDRRTYRNNILNNSYTTNSSDTYQSYNMYIGARNDYNVAGVFSTKETPFVSIGNGLTDGEASTFYTLVQNLQTSLSRQV